MANENLVLRYCISDFTRKSLSHIQYGYEWTKNLHILELLMSLRFEHEQNSGFICYNHWNCLILWLNHSARSIYRRFIPGYQIFYHKLHLKLRNCSSLKKIRTIWSQFAPTLTPIVGWDKPSERSVRRTPHPIIPNLYGT